MELKVYEGIHPNPIAQKDFDNLIGIDDKKEELLNTLRLLLNVQEIDKWHKTHHESKLKFVDKISTGLPMIILSGDVGCGKTALANSVATPLAKVLDRRITCFETPSNIRGAGRVGEISNRITETFDHVKGKLGKNDVGILVIDEADDLATSRDQNQAHHEDRAGLNVLIKQIDMLSRDNCQLVVILITNRLKVLDPAVIRRAARVIQFKRPNGKALREVFDFLFEGIDLKEGEMRQLIETASAKDRPYSFSDLIQKAGKQAVFTAVRTNQPFSISIYQEVLMSTEPSPVMD